MGACIVPLYKGNGDNNRKRNNSRGISLLSVVGKLYDIVLIKRVWAGTECAIGEEQCGFSRVEVAWTKCVKSIYGKCFFFVVYGFGSFLS